MDFDLAMLEKEFTKGDRSMYPAGEKRPSIAITALQDMIDLGE